MHEQPVDSDSSWIGDVDPEVDSRGFRSALDRWLKTLDTKALPSGLVLDPLAPQTPRIRPMVCESAGSAEERFTTSKGVEENCSSVLPCLGWVELPSGEGALLYEELANIRTLHEALLYHYHERPICAELMQLLQVVADAVRSLHESGVGLWLHGGLNTHAVLVRMDENGVWDKAFLRGLIYKTLPKDPEKALEWRGQDNAQLPLPSDFRRVFFEMQFAPDLVPQPFLDVEAKRRQIFASQQEEHKGDRPLPPEKDIWIWDDRSMQAIPALKSRDKRKYYRKRDLGGMIGAQLTYGSSLKREAKKIQTDAWSDPVEMDGKIGLSLNLEPERFEPERRWLEPLGTLPLLVRMYHHETEARQKFAIEAIRRLQAEGHQVSVALVQDRCAVLQPNCWQRFVERTAGALSGFVEGFEVGHAINRVKWGFWNVPEYRAFLEPFQNWKDRYPQIPLMGPAGIDFEFPRILPMLNQWPAGSLSAYSHHMYVDRRGAPENKQSGYDLEAKLAYARAVARLHPACEERVVVSEVNWPLQGTGVWSPVGSPYQSPGERTGDPSVDEETYAEYMRRYLLIALCSGLVDQVYWWNLAAHGFGLVDDRHPEGWRPRPAYHAFKELVALFRGSRFDRRTSLPEGWTYFFSRGEESFTLRTTLKGVESG